MPRDRVVARRLAVEIDLSYDRVHNRIEPVHAAHRHREPLIQQVAALVVGELVAQHIFVGAVPLRQVERRKEQPGQKRSVGPAGAHKPHPSAENAAVRARICAQPPCKQHIAAELIQKHRPRAAQPQRAEVDCGFSARKLPRRSRGNILRRRSLLRVRRRSILRKQAVFAARRVVLRRRRGKFHKGRNTHNNQRHEPYVILPGRAEHPPRYRLYAEQQRPCCAARRRHYQHGL